MTVPLRSPDISQALCLNFIDQLYLLQKTLGNRPVEEIKLATLAKSVFMNEHSFDSAKLAAGAAIDLGRPIQMTIIQSC